MPLMLNNAIVGLQGRATVLDLDTGAPIVATPGIRIVSRPSAFVEEGAAQTLSFRLRTLPTDSVDVDVTATGLTITPASRTFTVSNWDTAQSVSITADGDADENDESVVVTLTGDSNDTDYDSATTTFTVTVVDDDRPTPAFVFSATDTIALTEGGSTTRTIKLAALPTADVTVTMVSDDEGAAVVYDTVGGLTDGTLEFTTSNWDTAQSFTVLSVDDTDESDESVTISFTASGGGYNAVTGSQTVTVTDDDGAVANLWMTGRDQAQLHLITFSDQGATATDVGSATNFDASENFPSGLAYGNDALYMGGNQTNDLFTINTTTGVATSIGDFSLTGNAAPTGMTFAGDVLYMLNNNRDRLNTVNLSTGAATESANQLGQASNVRSLVWNGTSLFGVHLNGSGTGQLFRIATDTGTATNIGIAQFNLAEINGMTFHEGTLYAARSNATGSNYATSRLVTMDLTDGSIETVTTSNNLNVSETDPVGLASDTPGLPGGASGQTMGFVPANVPSSVTEGSTATFTVKLNASPTEGNTTSVTVVSNHTHGVTVTGGASLTFDTSDWDTAQTVTLTGAGGGGGIVAQIVLEASGGGFDDNRMQAFVANAPIDDSLIVGAHYLAIGEGKTKNFKVRLSSQPTDDVTVTTTSANSNKVYITAGATHTFTTSNWNSNHGIDLYGYADADGDDEYVDLTLTASGGGNSATAVRTIHVRDDD